MTDLTEFKISYDGSALRNHEMNVSELGTALLSIGELLTAANYAVNGEMTKVNVRVKAHEAGSFEIVMVLEFLKEAGEFLSGDFVTSVINLKELLFMGGYGLVSFIKKTKGKKPEKIEKKQDRTYTLTIENVTYTIPENLFKLYSSRPTRAALEKVISPVSKEGISKFSVKDGDQETVSVEKNEQEYFAVPEPEDTQIIDEIREGAYSIISLAFKEDNKWRLSDGQTTYSVAVKDEEFLKQVENNEISFAKNDVLICEIHIRQWQTAQGLKTEYDLEKVKKHLPAFQQMKLF